MLNGAWCSLVEIEEEFMRYCSPDLIRQALLAVNAKQVLVLIALVEGNPDVTELLTSLRQRVPTLPMEKFPRDVVITNDAFPLTNTYKIKREAVMKRFRGEIEAASSSLEESVGIGSNDSGNGAVINELVLAESILGHEVNPEVSFMENGGDSMTAVRWARETKLRQIDTEGNSERCRKDFEWGMLLHIPLIELARRRQQA